MHVSGSLTDVDSMQQTRASSWLTKATVRGTNGLYDIQNYVIQSQTTTSYKKSFSWLHKHNIKSIPFYSLDTVQEGHTEGQETQSGRIHMICSQPGRIHIGKVDRHHTSDQSHQADIGTAPCRGHMYGSVNPQDHSYMVDIPETQHHFSTSTRKCFTVTICVTNSLKSTNYM
jgi:hypothetical protein